MGKFVKGGILIEARRAAPGYIRAKKRLAGVTIRPQALNRKVKPPGSRGWNFQVATTRGGRDNRPHRQSGVTDGWMDGRRRSRLYTYRYIRGTKREKKSTGTLLAKKTHRNETNMEFPILTVRVYQCLESRKVGVIQISSDILIVIILERKRPSPVCFEVVVEILGKVHRIKHQVAGYSYMCLTEQGHI